MKDALDFSAIVTICNQAREQFRSYKQPYESDINKVFSLFIEVFQGIGILYSAEELAGSRQAAAIVVIVQAIEIVLAMYFMAEDGFWDTSLTLKRNYTELLLVGIAIGYDQQCYIDWKHERDNFDSFTKIYRRVEQNNLIPSPEKDLLPVLNKYWIESSRLYSHNIKRSSIRTMLAEGNIGLEPKVATNTFQEERTRTIRNMLVNIVSVLIGITDFARRAYEYREKYPQGARIISIANECFQNNAWKNQHTS